MDCSSLLLLCLKLKLYKQSLCIALYSIAQIETIGSNDGGDLSIDLDQKPSQYLIANN